MKRLLLGDPDTRLNGASEGSATLRPVGAPSLSQSNWDYTAADMEDKADPITAIM